MFTRGQHIPHNIFHYVSDFAGFPFCMFDSELSSGAEQPSVCVTNFSQEEGLYTMDNYRHTE